MGKLFIVAAAAVMTAGLSTAAWAGGHGGFGGHPMVMMHPGGGWHGGGVQGGGWHGGGRSLPPVAGTIHVRPNGSVFSGFGHSNTALGRRPFPGVFGRPGFARGPGPFYGHTNTAFGGWGRGIQFVHGSGPRYGHTATRFGFSGYRTPYFAGADRFGRRGLRYGSYGRDFRFHRQVAGLGGFRGYRGYGGSGYGGDYGGFAYPSSGPSYGYVEAPLAAQYAEPPLNGGGDYGYAGGGDYAGGSDGYGAPSSDGGPLILTVGHRAAGASLSSCSCSHASPVVYRFGVGSYY